MIRLVIFSCLLLATFADSDSRPKPTEERIVGGRNTDITEVPYQVSVQYKEKHSCGGSIIGPKHILTAAHCVEKKNSSLFTVRAGSNYHDKEGQVVTVVKVTRHPYYDSYIVDYDAAILELKESLTLGSRIRAATLANIQPRTGEMILISGWGSTQKGKGRANFLQSVSIPVISKKLCKQKYDDDENISDRMFCAGHSTGGKDSCKGDSGGPAVIKGKLAGIVSWGEDCGDERYPGVYTNIASILPWIEAQIRK